MLGLGLGLNKSNALLASFAQLVKSAGGVLYLDARKADGSAPLTGNSSPWVDLTGNNNDGTLTNQAGTVTSGWQGPPYVDRFDGVDDRLVFANAASLDITTAPFVQATTLKANSTQPSTTYLFNRNLTDLASMQYGMQLTTAGVLNQIMNGSGVKSVTIPQDIYVNVISYWDGVDVKMYINGVQNGVGTSFVSSLVSAPNTQYGSRSTNADGTTQSFFLDGDVVTNTVYSGAKVDINKIISIEAKISAQYLALNP